MKNNISKTNLLVVLLMLLIASLIGATTTTYFAHAQEEQPKSTVVFTSYTSIMGPGEVYEFAAQATAPDGTVTDELTWTSSDTSVIQMEDNLAFAQELGEDVTEKTAIITATAKDGGYASINVLVTTDEEIRVTDIRIYPEVLEVGIDWTTRLSYTILPQDAYEQGATWTSSNPSVITVDSNGNAKAMAKGTATITVTARDSANDAYAVCDVIVYDDLVEGTIAPDTLVMSVGETTTNQNDLVLTLPDSVMPKIFR